jgi:hypothetical protein
MIKPLPHGLTIEESNGILKINRKWFSAVFIFLLIFSIAWDCFLIFWYSTAISIIGQPDSSNFTMLITFIFPLGHVIAGICLSYYAITGLFNTTTIQVEQGLLKVQHHPLPWFGNKKIQVLSLKQLYCNEVCKSSKSGFYYVYDLNAITTDNKQIKLIKSLPEKSQGLFIEEKIENYLGIKDEEVQGEIEKEEYSS